MKKVKAPRFAHTSSAKKGMGDYYGTGVKQKLARVIDGTGQKVISAKKLKTPPKGVA